MSNGSFISPDEAEMFINQYRDANPESVHATAFDRHLLMELLREPDVSGVRIYNGYNEEGNHCHVIFCTDADGNDMTDKRILERGKPCPPYCTSGGVKEDGAAS